MGKNFEKDMEEMADEIKAQTVIMVKETAFKRLLKAIFLTKQMVADVRKPKSYRTIGKTKM